MKKQLISIDPIRDEIRSKLIEKYNTTTYMNTSSIKLELDVKDLLEEHIKEKELQEPRICITPEAYLKMRKLVDDTDTEIGWYGTVDSMPGLNTYVITDIIVYPQKVTGATCEQDDDKMFDFEMSLTDEQVNHKRFHGHSHVNMTTGPSGVDENFYQDILTQVTDFFIITVTNKRNDYTTRFYDVENNILYSDIPIEIISDTGFDIDSWYNGVKELLHRPEPVTPKYNDSYRQSSLYDDPDDYYDIWDKGFYGKRYGIGESKNKKSAKKKGRM